MTMEGMKPEDRRLFFKYALPCAGTLVKRGKVTQEYINGLVELVSNGGLPEDKAESIFKVANAMCPVVAEKMGKRGIDSDVIRQYFLLEHSAVVDDRYELMGDFDPVACKTYKGKVMRVEDGHAVVRTSLGEKPYRTTFAKQVQEGDEVVVHWDYVVEIPPDSFLQQMG